MEFCLRDETSSKSLELNEGRSGPELLSQLKGFLLTKRLDGISVLGSASASSRDRFCVHNQQNKGQPRPLIFQKGKHGNGITSDALLLQGNSCGLSEGSFRKLLWQLSVCLVLRSYTLL